MSSEGFGSKASLDVAAVALGVSAQVDCGGGMQVVFQTHLDRDADEGERQRVLDLVHAIAERLIQHQKRKALLVEIADWEATIDVGVGQFGRARETYQEAKARRGQEAEKAAKADEDSWAEKGRRGDYTPSGGYIQRRAALIREQEQADAERDMTEKNYEATRQMLLGKIATAKAIVSQLDQVLYGPDRQPAY